MFKKKHEILVLDQVSIDQPLTRYQTLGKLRLSGPHFPVSTVGKIILLLQKCCEDQTYNCKMPIIQKLFEIVIIIITYIIIILISYCCLTNIHIILGHKVLTFFHQAFVDFLGILYKGSQPAHLCNEESADLGWEVLLPAVRLANSD